MLEEYPSRYFERSSFCIEHGFGLLGWLKQILCFLYFRTLELSHKRTSMFEVITKGLSSALIVAGGDAFCQLVIEDGSFDAMRCARMFLIGGLLVAPALHFW